MPKIQIIAIPPGEAPQHIRQAWIGVRIPLPPAPYNKCRKYFCLGVISGQIGVFAQLLAILKGEASKLDGYAVDATLAINTLAETNAEASHWWQTNAPHLMKPGKKLIFPADVCLEENDLDKTKITSYPI